MRIRIIGMTVCLLGMTYTASAGNAWSVQAGAATPSKPAIKTAGYTWNQAGDTTAEKPAIKTAGYTWSQAGDTTAEKPAFKTDCYTWNK